MSTPDNANWWDAYTDAYDIFDELKINQKLQSNMLPSLTSMATHITQKSPENRDLVSAVSTEQYEKLSPESKDRLNTLLKLSNK